MSGGNKMGKGFLEYAKPSYPLQYDLEKLNLNSKNKLNGTCLSFKYAFLSLKGKSVQDKYSPGPVPDGFLYESLYAFGIYSRYLGGWYSRVRYMFAQDFTWTTLSGRNLPLMFNLAWNVNNLIDEENFRFIGIDGSGVGRDCGFLQQLRKTRHLTEEEKYDILWYLFVTESCFAVYYAKQVEDYGGDMGSFDKYGSIGPIEEYRNFPWCYAFLPYYDQLSLNGSKDEILERNFHPQVILDKYITNLAEAEVFMFFLRIIACICAGSIGRMFFGGKKWYEGDFPKTGFRFVRWDDNGKILENVRKECFEFLVNVYQYISEVSSEYEKTSSKGLGGRGKAKMSIKVIFWLLLVKIGDIWCFDGANSQSLIWRCKSRISGVIIKMVPSAGIRNLPW